MTQANQTTGTERSGAQAIMVGVDYSDSCIPALDQALELSSSSGRQLVLVLALPGGPATRPAEARELHRDLVERSKQNLIRLAESRANALLLTVPKVISVVRFGAPAACLLEEARERPARLIVVGTHGRRGIEHFVLGSVAEEVVHKAPCSVLVARAVEAPAPTAEAGGGSEGAEAAEAADSGAPGEAEHTAMLGAPHLDAGRVVLPVLDIHSGQVFICSFDDLETVRVEPLEGNWVPQPSSSARARVAEAAIAEAKRAPALFGPLFAELERRARAGR